MELCVVTTKKGRNSSKLFDFIICLPDEVNVLHPLQTAFGQVLTACIVPQLQPLGGYTGLAEAAHENHIDNFVTVVWYTG
jgi:hypothetical protein